MQIIVEAEQTTARFRASRANHPAAQDGLRFERKVFRELQKILNGPDFKIYHNPWFRYRTGDGIDHFCSPDIILTDFDEGYAIVIEVKLSWVPGAIEKLRNLYCPIVSRVWELPTKPLVIAKNSGPNAPQANSRLGFAIMTKDPFLLWHEDGPISL